MPLPTASPQHALDSKGEDYFGTKSKLVFVEFPGATWHVPGAPGPGIYPIVPRQRGWFLDKGRTFPVLEIKRRQLPLIPAFSLTAHAAQGQTLKAAIVDLLPGIGSNPLTSYVAFTRVQRRSDVLICRPFSRD